MVGRTEEIVGNLLLYEYLLSKRNPTFLNRNLVQALEHRKRDLRTRSNLGPRLHLNSFSSKRARWRYPSDEALRKMIEDEDAKKAFVIELKRIEPLSNKASGRPAKNVLLFRIEIDIQITIVHDAVVCKRLEPETVTMIGTHSPDCGKHVSLVLSPVKIRLSEILRARAPESPWRKASPRDWDLLVTLNFHDTPDAQEFYGHMAPPTSPLHRDPSTRLLMNWTNIRECPEGDQVIPLSTKSSSGADQLDLGILAKLYWTTSNAGSLLEAYNQQQDNGLRYPTPLPTPRSAGKDYRLTFIIADKQRVQYNLGCPHDPCLKHCNQIDELQMHLESWHEKFKYTFTKERTISGVEQWLVNCELAEPREDTAPGSQEMWHLAPQEPFNRRRYLYEGNNNFQRASRGERADRSRLRPVGSKARKTGRLRHPDEVQERRRVAKRTYRVPKAPSGVTFFRSISKRPLQEGEYISESDDEVEMGWLQQMKDAQLDNDPALSEANKRFIRIFDPFVRADRIPDDAHIGDSMVRFARAHAATLWSKDVVDEFRTKITELLEDRLITRDVHAGCLAIVHKHDPAKTSHASGLGEPLSTALNQLSGSPQTRNKGKGKAVVDEAGQITPQTAVSEGDVEMRDAALVSEAEAPKPVDMSNVDQCLCGQNALFGSRNRPYIVCESVICVRHAFHLDCVVRYWKPPQPPDPDADDWICPDCQPFV